MLLSVVDAKVDYWYLISRVHHEAGKKKEWNDSLVNHKVMRKTIITSPDLCHSDRMKEWQGETG